MDSARYVSKPKGPSPELREKRNNGRLSFALPIDPKTTQDSANSMDSFLELEYKTVDLLTSVP